MYCIKYAPVAFFRATVFKCITMNRDYRRKRQMTITMTVRSPHYLSVTDIHYPFLVPILEPLSLGCRWVFRFPLRIFLTYVIYVTFHEFNNPLGSSLGVIPNQIAWINHVSSKGELYASVFHEIVKSTFIVSFILKVIDYRGIRPVI